MIECVPPGLKTRDVARAVGATEHVAKDDLRLIYDELGRWNALKLAV